MILKLDVKDCGQCPCLEAEESFWGDLCRAKCRVTGENVLFNIGIDRNKKCPLKSVPNKMAEEWRWFTEDYAKGWNTCIEEILND